MVDDNDSKTFKFLKIWKSSKKKQFEPIPSTSSTDTFQSSSNSSSNQSLIKEQQDKIKTDVKTYLKVPERRRTQSETKFDETYGDMKQISSRRRAYSENRSKENLHSDTKSLLSPDDDNSSITSGFSSSNMNKYALRTVPAIVLSSASDEHDSPLVSRSRENLIDISNAGSDGSFNLLTIGDSVQEFRSLPDLSEVPHCSKCKNVRPTPSGRKKCWDVITDWCRFPRMKCACMDTNSYERLPSVGGFLALSALVGSGAEDKDSSTEKQEELLFYNDDGSYQTVVVERNLCASDLCQLLALKNRVAKDVNWTIVEHWVDLGLERLLEDHEDVLSAHRDMENYSRHAECRFIFRKDFRKYEFFHHPQQFFPPDMIDIEHCEDFLGTGICNPAALQNLVALEGQCPSVFSHIWVRDPNKQTWAKGFLLLRDKKLYLSYKVQVVAKFLRSGKQREANFCPVSEADAGNLSVFARLSDYFVYATLNAKNQFRAPTEWGICLRPSGADGTDSAEDDAGPGLRCLACDSERARTCWLTAMRLAKYGKQLRENYRAFKNKQVESINPKEYNSYTVPNESVRSRVAMDFTGSVGRIVEDPKEAKAIAAAEGYSWRRRWRPTTRAPAHSPIPQGIESGVHITQPWFHSGMSRDQAAALVTRYGTVDGVFLVRDSRSNPGAFVLTYKCGGKVLHTQITPILDPVREAHVFSLDNGFTKFYDLLQLVEFYQLNAGVLPTRLTHYVVQSPTGVSVPSNNVSSHPSVAGSY